MNKLNHIAFIMDGNGRWGKNKKKGRNYGHIKGVDTIKKIIKGSIKLKIPPFENNAFTALISTPDIGINEPNR